MASFTLIRNPTSLKVRAGFCFIGNLDCNPVWWFLIQFQNWILDCEHGRPLTFFQGGARTYFLPKKHQKTYYFSQKSPKTYYFWPALAGQGGGKRPPLPPPLRTPMIVNTFSWHCPSFFFISGHSYLIEDSELMTKMSELADVDEKILRVKVNKAIPQS
jgi:hypothetical protein